MAQVRAAVRAYVAIDPDPSAVLTKLDQLTAVMPVSDFVTIVYLLFDASLDRFSLISAGHPPAILVPSDAAVSVLWPAPGTPLGLSMDRTAASFALAEGATVLLYSDGLIERRDEAIDVGIDRLARDAQRLARGQLRAELKTLAGAAEHVDDDVTLLAIRRQTT